jgi:protein-tyrosine phosphatase
MIYCRYPLVDGAGNDLKVLGLAIRTAATLLRGQVPTMICCGAGVSRAPAVAAAALSLVFGKPAADCLAEVVAHHPADVSPGLWDDVASLLPSLA